MSDVGRKTVPDKGHMNRERPVTKALEFPFCTGKRFFSSELKRRVRDGVLTERQDDRHGGRVPSKKRKAKVAILKSILCLTGGLWGFLRRGVTCSDFGCMIQIFFFFFEGGTQA